MKQKKFIIGIMLIICLFSIMSYSSIYHNKYDPDITYILENFNKYNNTKLKVTGQILNINKSENSLVIQLMEPPYKTMEIKYDYLEDDPQNGDIIELYVKIERKTHITAEKTLVTPKWRYNLIFLRSIPAIPFVLYIFFRGWRFNKDKIKFEKRKEDA